MARTCRPFTALDIKQCATGTYAVGGATGLYFRKNKSQSLFFLRYTDETGRHDLSLGQYPSLTLVKAREEANRLMSRIQKGVDVLAERREKQASAARRKYVKHTFADVSREWVKARVRLNYWKNDDRGEARTLSILEMYVFPAIGSKDINKVTVDDVCNLLTPIWTTKYSTARKAKTYIYKVFQWAIAKKICKLHENPGDSRFSLGILMEPLQKHAATSKHYAACDVAEIPLFFFHSARYNSASARACEFAILTCSRSKAVREATWDEIDLNKGVWTIPVEHDKIKTEGRDRRIFLSNQAIELLRSLPRYPGSKVLFPNQRGCPLSDAALTMFLRGMHEDRMVTDGRGWIDPMLKKANGNPAIITIHGSARATFRTWAKSDIYENNRRFDQEAVELCLLHAKRDAYKGAYDRAFLERERQLIMSAWGEYCWSMRNARKNAQQRSTTSRTRSK